MCDVKIDKFLTREEEAELVKRAQSGDVDARNKVVLNVYPYLFARAGKYARMSGIPQHDLLHHAIERCLEKFHLFDLSRGIRAMTYLNWVGERQMQRMTRVDGIIARPPDMKNVTAEESRRRAEAANYVASLTALVTTKEGEDALGRALAVDNTTNEEAAASEGMEVFFELLKCLRTDRERRILHLRIVDGKSLKHVGQLLGITRERVRQIQVKALATIRAEIEGKTPPVELARAG